MCYLAMNIITWMYVLGMLTGLNLGLTGFISLLIIRNPKIRVKIQKS